MLVACKHTGCSLDLILWNCCGRYDPEADTAARGRASGSRADPTWGRANAEGAGQQRVLRRRDPRGHGGVKDARRDAWRDKDKEQLGTGASQGILHTIINVLLLA